MITGIFRFLYSPLVASAFGIMRADSAALACIWEGRTAISFGKSSNFVGTDLGPKITFSYNGQTSLLTSGDTVWLSTSPKPGMAGVAIARKSGRGVGK
jgi:hypothetical protein